MESIYYITTENINLILKIIQRYPPKIEYSIANHEESFS
jgi:hypothetical protein